jgi:hypothetical protein
MAAKHVASQFQQEGRAMRNLIRSISFAAMAVFTASAIAQGSQAIRLASPSSPSMASGSAIKLNYVGSAKISKLLGNARVHANRAADTAERLDMLTNNTSAPWQAHAVKLNDLRQNVNELGKINTQLSYVKQEGSLWQQIAITRIDSQLRILAAELTETISHLNAHPERVYMPPYVKHVRATYNQAKITSELVSDFVQYGKARANASSRIPMLEQKLDLPPTYSVSGF